MTIVNVRSLSRSDLHRLGRNLVARVQKDRFRHVPWLRRPAVAVPAGKRD